ncbi:YceI family protein [Hymenobacter koreensis]|uniref:Lipid/polyisoprenoid-binding YceI-like domain-containing protein n=1 Tax=Hymenobacter koreensis TaxID=1084523 RepID=A0ABP8J2K8_9BACT
MKPGPVCYLLGLLLVLLVVSQPGWAQAKYMTKTGRVSFFSTSIIEDIEAHNTAVAAVLDLGTGQMAFSAPIKEFTFKRSLMQEHFNENYMESGKFPRATFTGRFTGADAAMLAKSGSHPVQVEGTLTLHGVAKHVKVAGTMEQKNGQVLAFAFFSVAPADYGIDIPMLVRENIAKIVSIKVSLTCDPAAGNAAPLPSATNSN